MTDAVSESTAAPLSEGQRVVDTFIAPSRTFTDILRKSTWWGPLIVLIVVSAIFSYATQQKVGWEKVFENNVHQSPKAEAQMAQLPPERLAAQKAISEKITQYVSYGYWILLLMITAVSSLLVWATINFGFGGTAKYGQVYAVHMYANLVMNVKYLLAVVSLFAGLAPDSFLQQNPVGTNVGYYLGNDMPKWLSVLMTHIDIFEIWALILTVIGISIVAKVKRGAATATVVGWWVIFLLIGVGMAAING